MLIILTSKIDPPALTDIKIRDAESGLNIAVGGLTGWDDDFLQAQAICYAPMILNEAKTGLSAASEIGLYWVRRYSKVVVRVSFSNAGANAVIRPLYYDTAEVEIAGDSATVTAIARQTGSLYMAPIEVFDTYGAKQMAFLVESISAGTIDIQIAGV